MATDSSAEDVAAKFSNSRDSTGTNQGKVSSPPHDDDVVEESSSDVRKRKSEELFDELGETELAQRTLNPFHDAEEEIQNNNTTTVNPNNTNRKNDPMNDPMNVPFDEQDENIKGEDDASDDKKEKNGYDYDDKEDDDEKVVDFNEEQFFSAPSFTPEEMAKVEPRIRKMIADPFQKLEANGYEIFTKYLKEREQKKDRNYKAQRGKMQQSFEDATIRGDPREYQRALFEIAKTKNTIVNLGTGFGKTLIALLCIRHFSPDFEQGKQTVFLVPSVALAIQQSATLHANLPGFSVHTACYASSNSDASRRALGKANVIVATHGAVSEKGLKCVYVWSHEHATHTCLTLSLTHTHTHRSMTCSCTTQISSK
jgi:primosomal protein N'